MNRPTKKLSKAEQKVFSFLLEAYSYKDIAEALSVEIVTIKKHVSNILTKYRYTSSLELVVAYYKQQLRKG
jgi:DNA-binding NarL/FixJ family response regulator